jgi:hypothetical protein
MPPCCHPSHSVAANLFNGGNGKKLVMACQDFMMAEKHAAVWWEAPLSAPCHDLPPARLS